MQGQKTKLTHKKAEFVKENLYLSNKELAEETGLELPIIRDIRMVQNTPHLQPANKSGAQKTAISEDPDKISVRGASWRAEVSYSKMKHDIKRLDFLEYKTVGRNLYITMDEFEDYKDFLEEDDQ